MARGKRLIGLLLILLSFMGMIGWEKWGKDRFLYDDVLVLKENVEKGTIITENMVTVKKMDIDEDYISFEEKEEVLGKQASAFLHKGVPLFDEYLQEPNLSPNEESGYYGMCLPQEWIASKPMALSRGDEVFFFYGENFITAAHVSAVGEEGEVEVVVSKSQVVALCEITAKGGRLVLVYQ